MIFPLKVNRFFCQEYIMKKSVLQTEPWSRCVYKTVISVYGMIIYIFEMIAYVYKIITCV